MSNAKRIFVTGGNSGIGFALCKQLLKDHGCHVYLGSRSETKGRVAIDELLKACPEASGRLDLVRIDISSDESVAAAATTLKNLLGDAKLFGLVNNAGTGLGHGARHDEVINTNLYGPKRVMEAFVHFLDAAGGRIVNVGSTAGATWLEKQDEATRGILTSWEVTWPQIESIAKATFDDADDVAVYSMSKACVHAYTRMLSKMFPNLMLSAVCPGLIDTNMTKGTGFGATKQPETGTVSITRCLFDEDLPGSGLFYVCDGSQGPLDKFCRV